MTSLVKVSTYIRKENCAHEDFQLLPVGRVRVLAAAFAFGAPMTTGKADLKSAGPLAFGPDGILFVGDSMGAKIFAIDTEDRAANASGAPLDIKGIDAKIAAALGTTPIRFRFMSIAVNPISKNVYLRSRAARARMAVPVIAAPGRLRQDL